MSTIIIGADCDLAHFGVAVVELGSTFGRDLARRLHDEAKPEKNAPCLPQMTLHGAFARWPVAA